MTYCSVVTVLALVGLTKTLWPLRYLENLSLISPSCTWWLFTLSGVSCRVLSSNRLNIFRGRKFRQQQARCMAGNLV